ncbi:hypothetical protein H1R20_g2738, partial [Candolleomyces eurysporus]
MPEAPEVFGFFKKIDRLCKEEERVTGQIPQAQIRLFPRCFALGSDTKKYFSISIDCQHFDKKLEEPDPNKPPYTPNSNDLANAITISKQAEQEEKLKLKAKKAEAEKAKRAGRTPEPVPEPRETSCVYLVDRPLKQGPLVYAMRGKCLVVAAGHHAVTINFGLESSVYILSRLDFEALTAIDAPGPNKNAKKAQHLRVFKVPSQFIDPGSPTEQKRTISIFCAFVMTNHVIIVADFARLARLHITSSSTFWSAKDLQVGSKWRKENLFSQFPDGPDWVLETNDAFERLDSWRQSCMEDKSTPIVVALTTNTSKAFGGFGRHLANDYLYHVAIPPGLSVSEMWQEKEFVSRCITTANSSNPFTFNHISNNNYLKMYCKVYFKKFNETWKDVQAKGHSTTVGPASFPQSGKATQDSYWQAWPSSIWEAKC